MPKRPRIRINTSAKRAPIARQVISNKRQISILRKRPEIKHKFFRSDGGIPAGFTASLLNGMTRGDNWGEREGNQVKMVNIQQRMLVFNTLAVSAFVRILLIVSKTPSGVAPIPAAIFTDIVSNKRMLVSNYKKGLQFTDNFRVLYDELFVLSGDEDYMNAQHRNKSFLLGEKVAFLSTSALGSIVDIENNAVYYITVSAEVSNDIEVTQHTDIGYYDE